MLNKMPKAKSQQDKQSSVMERASAVCEPSSPNKNKQQDIEKNKPDLTLNPSQSMEAILSLCLQPNKKQNNMPK